MKRDSTMDYLKVIGIILMLLGHTDSPLIFYIYTFHMGLFFFVSGFLCYGRTDIPFTEYTKKRFKSCLIPYFVFWAIGLLISEIYQLITEHSHILLNLNTLKGLLLGGHYLSEYSNNFPIWYLQTNFIVAILFFVIIKLCKNDIAKLVVFVAILIGTIPFQLLFEERPVFHINVLPAAITYMFLGYFVALLKKYIDKIPFFVGLILLIPNMITWPNHIANIANIASYTYYLYSFLTIIGLYITFKKVPGNKFITFMSKSTIYILGLHFPLLPISNRIAAYLREAYSIDNNHILSIVQTVFLAAVCCIAGYIYELIKRGIRTKIQASSHEH